MKKNPCWKNYKAVGLKKKGKKLVPRASLLSYLLASQIYEPVQAKTRYLTREEQRVFRKALLLSARSIHKAKRPSASVLP